MVRSYRDIAADRGARPSPESAAQREVLEKAYDIALQVIDLREKHGLTQAQLAERCGIDQGDVSRIESGNGNPTVKTIGALARALGAELRITSP